MYLCHVATIALDSSQRDLNISTRDSDRPTPLCFDAVHGMALDGTDDYPPWGRGWCTALACSLEASAPKPGNVYPGANFDDLSYDELIRASAAIAPVMQRAAGQPLGRTILDAVTASRRVTRSNANLGIVLAIAPIAAVSDDAIAATPFRPESIAAVLATLSPADATSVWRAIALAQPGGMGGRDTWDVAGPAPDHLLAAMHAAATYDQIAHLWAHGYQTLCNGLVRDLLEELHAGHTLGDAIVRSHLRQLAREPDSLIARKHGLECAADVSARAACVLAQTDNWREATADFDRHLRWPVRLNPGTTADLLAAGLYILLIDGRLRRLLGATPSLRSRVSFPSA